MGVISGYPDDATTTDSDRLLTYAADGTTKLTPASNINKYVGLGWTIATDAWTYSSYNATTFLGVLNAQSGANTRYSVGMWIMFTQPTLGVKYAKIISVTTSTITALFTAGTILSNESITLPFYSVSKAPLGSNGKTTASDIDFSTSSLSGAGGIWWEEIGRQTLASASDVITLNIPARRYLRIQGSILNSGNVTMILRFNNDSGNSYAYRTSTNGAASDATAAPTSSIVINSGPYPLTIWGDIINYLPIEKIAFIDSIAANAVGAANLPGRSIIGSKWSNTASQITRIDLINTDTGDFAAGSELTVLGHD